VKFEKFITEYNNCIDELNDAKLIIRELKMKLRERDISQHISRNSNILLFIIENEVIIFIAMSKKLLDSSIFTDDKDLIIDD
jgi:hypothetical protein